MTGSTVDGSLRPALRRAENIAPRANRAAIAFGDACDRRVFASTKSSTISRSRNFVGRLSISTDPPDTGQVVILIPRRAAAVVLRRPVPRSRTDRVWRQWDHLREEPRRTEIETQGRASVADVRE
jgi:hypothetical protein